MGLGVAAPPVRALAPHLGRPPLTDLLPVLAPVLHVVIAPPVLLPAGPLLDHVLPVLRPPPVHVLLAGARAVGQSHETLLPLLLRLLFKLLPLLAISAPS